MSSVNIFGVVYIIVIIGILLYIVWSGWNTDHRCHSRDKERKSN